MNKKTLKRFAELKEEMQKVKDTQHTTHSEMMGQREFIDNETFLEWKVKVKSIIVNVSGTDSEYYKDFIALEKASGFGTNVDTFKKVKSVFLAIKEDFESGYLTSMRTLVQAEIFESELEQASELLENNYSLAAAVIAGVVLETGVRELCDRANISYGKLDKMNSELTKAGIYNKLQQKRITALADIRNSAAHGKTEEFEKEDVVLMIRDIEQFLATQLED